MIKRLLRRFRTPPIVFVNNTPFAQLLLDKALQTTAYVNQQNRRNMFLHKAIVYLSPEEAGDYAPGFYTVSLNLHWSDEVHHD